MHGLEQLPLHIKGILGNEDIVNTYFLVAGGEGLLVDAGREADTDARVIIDRWRELGEPRMKGIILTHAHPDHTGAAELLRDFWNAPISMHPADMVLLERTDSPLVPDKELSDGQELDTPLGSATVLHTPGHSPGSVCLYFEGSGLLITGDQVLTNGTVFVGEPFGNMTDYLESMRKLLKLDIHDLAPGHGRMISDGWRHVLEMHEHRLRREGEITMSLKTGPKSSLDVAKLIYTGRNVPDEILSFGARQTECHLKHLERSGVVEADPEGQDRWRLRCQ